MEIPPILPDAEEELRSYLICVEKLPMHEYERNQEFWPRKPKPERLFYHENSPLCSTLKVTTKRLFPVVLLLRNIVLDTT